MGALGAAIVLMNPRFADLRQLGAALGTGRTAESARIGLELDLSDFNLESLDVDTSALDGLGGMFEAFGDIGDIGDSGGGDGGGGDGDSGGGE